MSSSLDRRLAALESAGPRTVAIADLFDEDGESLSPDEEARRIAAAQEHAGLCGIVVLWRYEEGERALR